MTEVRVFKSGDKIRRIRIEGHSGYAPVGKDIVCSAVSTATILSGNLLTTVDPDNTVFVNETKAVMELSINRADADRFCFLIMENLLESLLELQKSYPQFLKVYL